MFMYAVAGTIGTVAWLLFGSSLGAPAIATRLFALVIIAAIWMGTMYVYCSSRPKRAVRNRGTFCISG